MAEPEDSLQRWRDRMDELRPLVREAELLEAAVAALDAVRPLPKLRWPTVRPGPPSEALAAIRDTPGLTPSELAEASGIPHSTIRAVLPALKNQGVLVSQQGRWYVASGVWFATPTTRSSENKARSRS